MKELKDDLKNSLYSIVQHFDDEDRGVRDRQIRQWRRLKLMWENIQHVYYSEVAHDWRMPNTEQVADDGDQAYYDKTVNIFRAYLESIIAALSVSVPPITCYPDDADNPLDIATAKTGDKIASQIFRHNNAPILWIHALFTFCTEGMTACYSYAKSDKSYGTYKEKKYENQDELREISVCPLCQAEMADELVTEEQLNKFAPGDEDARINAFLNEEKEICPSCAEQVFPDRQQKTFTVRRLVGISDEPKSRICIEVYGGLSVKVPVWARNQADCPYLIYSYETHYANVLQEYPELRGKIDQGGQSNYDLYEQWGRTSPQYRGEQPIHNVTVRNVWLRPAAYNILNEEQTNELRKEFPNGCKVVVVNDQVACAYNEALDDYWTLTYNPLADYVHYDPIGLLLVSVQDITNDLLSLVLQTVEHGIPQTFADPKVLNFNAYRNSEVIPGGIYPATPKTGRPLSEGFYEVKTATLSQEVLPFAQKVQEIGQMVSGALPSLFGGQMSGSRTASEYSMSRNQALQRLQTTWKMLNSWWKDIFGKVIPLYIKELKDDEHQVQKNEFGNYINVFIRKSELLGKIGSIELEANENLPLNWNQQKDAIMELFALNNEQVMATLASPENLPYIKKAMGLTEYVVPGEDDRQKQYEEIQQLVNSEPIVLPPDPMMEEQAMMMGQPPPPPQELPSIEVDPDLDNHELEADICRRWLISETGRLCKTDNQAGYKNVLLHMKMHKDIIAQMQMMEQQMMDAQSAGPGRDKEKPPMRNAGVPLQGDQNAPTVQ